MKIAVSSYSYFQAVEDGRIQLTDIIPIAKEMGYEGIEIVKPWMGEVNMPELAKTLKKQSEDYNLSIIAYMVSADFLKNGLDNQVDELKKEIEIASILGAPKMRHDSTAGADNNGNPVEYDKALQVVSEGYRRVTEFAASFGIRTMIENHGYFFQGSKRVKELIETVNHKNFGWCVDMGNFMCIDENSVDAVKVAAPMAMHAHAKDFHYKLKNEFIPGQGFFKTSNGNALRGAVIGHGVVNVPECLKLLKGAGYDGWLSVEFEGIEDCMKAVKWDIENLKAMLENI